jgi:hypothetical protein
MSNVILGTPFNDVLMGTNGDDVIFGNAGNDLIDGKAGDDIIHPGPGVDSVFGGIGNDRIVYTAFGDNANDQVDGGPGLPGFDPGINTLVTTVLVGDNFLNASSSALTPAIVWSSPMLLANINFVEVSNASVINGNPFVLDLSQDDSFGLPENLLAQNHYFAGMPASDTATLHALDYTVATGAITAGIPFDATKGIQLEGFTIKSTFFLDNALAAQANFQALVNTYNAALAAEAAFDSKVAALGAAQTAQANFAALIGTAGAAITAAEAFGAGDGYDFGPGFNPITDLADATAFYDQALADAQQDRADFDAAVAAYEAALANYIPGNVVTATALRDAFNFLVSEGYAVNPPLYPGNAFPLLQAQNINSALSQASINGNLATTGAALDAAIAAAQADVDNWAPLAQAVQDAWDDIVADPLFAGDPSGANSIADANATVTAHANAVLVAQATLVTDPLWVGGLPTPGNIAATEAAHDTAVANALAAVNAAAPIPGDIPGSLAALAAAVAAEMAALDGVPTSFLTVGGGEVALSYDGMAGKWVLTYTAPEKNFLQPIINLESTVDDGSVAVTGTQTDGSTVDFAVNFAYTFGANIDLSGAMTGYSINGSVNGNVITTGDGDDTVRMNGGDNTVFLNGGNNTVWQGPMGVNGNDTIIIAGDGDNTVGAGQGNDVIEVNGDGDNNVFGGAGDDLIFINGDGDNEAFGGAGVDVLEVNGNGNNIVGGGAGDDFIFVNGNGNNQVFGGAGADQIVINGNGANTVAGGASAGTAGNQIIVNGNGANTIFNGNGNDTVVVNNNAMDVADPRGVVLFGGVGNDTFIFGAGSAGTLTIEAGNGRNTLNIDKADLLFDQNVMIDLRGVFHTEAQVIAALADGPLPNTTVLTINGFSESLTFNGISRAELLASDDWLIV